MNCPKCHSEISKQNINILSDVGQCNSCDHIFKISENLDSVDDHFDINTPPQGCWIRRELNYVVIGATTRSAFAFFLVPFMMVWSGFSLGGIYGGQILKGHFDPVISLFGIPFLLGSVLFWSLALMSIWGKVELTLDKTGGKTFVGIGGIGFSKRFDWQDITTIKEGLPNKKSIGSQGTEIVMEGKKRIAFGNGVNDSRRYYLLHAMKSILSKVKSNKNFI